LPYGGPRPARFHLAPGADRTIVLTVKGTGCGTDVFGIHTHYHVFGLALSETVPAAVRIGPRC
jgi:type IV secretory pathway TrbD component